MLGRAADEAGVRVIIELKYACRLFYSVNGRGDRDPQLTFTLKFWVTLNTWRIE